MSADNSGGGFDFNRLAQQMGLGMGGGGQPQGADAPVKNFDELIERIFDMGAKLLGKFVNVKSDSLLNTGVAANVDPTKAGIQVNNQIMRQSFDVNGGVSVNILADGLQIASVKDFSKVTSPGGGEAPVSDASFAHIYFAGPTSNFGGATHVSDEASGQLHPSAGRGQSQGAGVDVASVG